MTVKGQSTLPPDAVDGTDDEPTPEWMLKPERPVSRYPDWLDGVDGVWKKVWSTWDYWLFEDQDRGVEGWGTSHEGLDQAHGRVLVVEVVMAKSALNSEHCAMEVAQRAARTAYQAIIKRQHELERAKYEVAEAEKAYSRLTHRGP